jgi:tetratricopeptide (TPR) repeat protein
MTTNTIRISAVVALFVLASATTAAAAHYAVNGFVLERRIPLNSSNYRSYRCQPSEDFDDYTYCQRTEQRRTSLGEGQLTSGILHAKDGTAIYLMANLAPVSIDQSSIEKEISELSSEIGQRPTKVDWLRRSNGQPTSVVAVWGRIELQAIKIDASARDLIKTEKDIGPGPMVDTLGDPVRSAKAGLPVYKIAGGAGYVYSASFDEKGRGHRHYVAADISRPAIEVFVPALRKVLQKDRSLGSSDYSLWPDVALATRNLSLGSSPEIADEELDKVFAGFPSQKLRSHVWSRLPLGTIDSLAGRVHWEVSTYGQKTEYPEIRDAIQKFLAAHPAEPFSEFLYYTLGDYDKALAANSHSVIASVIRYAIGFRIFGGLLEDVAKAVHIKLESAGDFDYTLSQLNAQSDVYGNKLLGTSVPDFAARAAAAQSWFEPVLRDSSSPLQDDAAYDLGWLAFQEGKFKEAFAYLGQAMTAGNHDYQSAAVREAIRVMSRFSPKEQAAIVAANPAFSQQPALWYVAARAAYRQFDFDLAIATGKQGLRALKISPDSLPATTDPDMIKQAVEKSLPKEVLTGDQEFDEVDLLEIPYLVEASQEFVQYDSFLKSLDAAQADNVAKRAREIVLKYSLLVDRPEHPAAAASGIRPMHRDLRQAVRLIDVTLKSVPKSVQYAPLREWLYYRKVRILTQYAPNTVADAVTAMQREFPKSDLLNDALAEQIYAEGVMLRDVPAAERTFQKLLKEFPKGNAVDNAYSWMAIIYRCAHKADLAKKMNMAIIGHFPLTRHAKYAAERMLHPDECGLTGWNSSH